VVAWGVGEADEAAVEGWATAESVCHRAAVLPRQDDQVAQSKPVGGPLATLDRGLGQE